MTEYGDRFAAAVAGELRAERARRKISYAQIIRETGIAQSTLQRYLKGEREIPVPVYMDICRSLGVSAAALLDRVQDALEDD